MADSAGARHRSGGSAEEGVCRNAALQGTALGKLPGHKTIKRRKSRKGNADGSGAGCSGGGGDSHDAGGDAGGCGSGGCGGGGCGS
jgi:hypothetical protein